MDLVWKEERGKWWVEWPQVVRQRLIGVVTSKSAPAARIGRVWPCPAVTQFTQFGHTKCAAEILELKEFATMPIWCWTRARSTLIVLKLWCAEAYRPSWDVSQLRCPHTGHDSSVCAGRHFCVHGISCAHSTAPGTFSLERPSLCCINKACITQVKTNSGPNSLSNFDMNKTKCSFICNA